MLSSKQFDVLVELERGTPVMAKEYLHMDERTFHAVCKELTDIGYLKDFSVTKEGYDILEPYRVKRAVLMAAGVGSRMKPLTYSIPKPLINVNGKRIIETLLDAIIESGIEEIYIILGYMKITQIKQIHIRNVDYHCANNIKSAACIGKLMENAYVLESDLVLYNPKVIRKYEYCSNYLGRKTDYTDDWCFVVENSFIRELLVGGSNVYHMYGISYWDKADAQRMVSDIKKVYESPDGAQKYWDEVALRDCKENYRIMVRPVYDGDILEIDSFAELQAIDGRYEE